MASANATTFGASIVPVRQRASSHETPPLPNPDSPSITPSPSHEDLRSTTIDPVRTASHSPIYSQQHPPAPLLSDHHSSPSKATTLINEKDLEAGPGSPLTTTDNTANPFTSKVSLDCNKECKMWPSKQTLLQSRMAEKRRKRETKWCGGCGPVKDFWSTLTARQKLLVKILVAFFVVGAAVAIGVGISIAVHGPVYVNPNQSQQIPDPQSR